MCRVIQVVECIEKRRGKGTDDDPHRVIRQYFSMDGALLAEVDPCRDDPKAAAPFVVGPAVGQLPQDPRTTPISTPMMPHYTTGDPPFCEPRNTW